MRRGCKWQKRGEADDVFAVWCEYKGKFRFNLYVENPYMVLLDKLWKCERCIHRGSVSSEKLDRWME